jgi:hypothetical protein
MEEFIKYLLENLITKPEALTIEKQENPEGLVFLIDADEADRGKIIGKEGKVIRALRNLVNIRAQKEGIRVFLQLNF